MDDFDEIEYELTTSKDQKTVTVKFRAPRPINTQDLAWIMDYYARELERSLKQKTKAGKEEH